MNVKHIFAHLKKIIVHRRWVRRYCFMAGLYRQGLTHDLSKFSPTEFWEGVRYYQGTSSPIDTCKKANGYSMAWFHHRGRNRHHWEYWVDDFQDGMVPKLMPKQYAIEMFCDFLGAGHAYMGKSYTLEKEYAWWQKKRDKVVMHPAIKDFIDNCFAAYIAFGAAYVFDRLHDFYWDAVKKEQG